MTYTVKRQSNINWRVCVRIVSREISEPCDHCEQFCTYIVFAFDSVISLFPNGLATSSIHSHTHTHTHIAEVHNKANMKTWQRNRNNWSIIYCYHVVSISHTYSVRRFSVVAFTGSLVSLIAWLASYIVRSALIIIDFGIMVRRTTNKCTIECACWCDNHTPTLR